LTGAVAVQMVYIRFTVCKLPARAAHAAFAAALADLAFQRQHRFTKRINGLCTGQALTGIPRVLLRLQTLHRWPALESIHSVSHFSDSLIQQPVQKVCDYFIEIENNSTMATCTPFFGPFPALLGWSAFHSTSCTFAHMPLAHKAVRLLLAFAGLALVGLHTPSTAWIARIVRHELGRQATSLSELPKRPAQS
jgi:hypothetical protein